jgi:multisubunit Na+/H+ antiporter MnhF subunit
MGLGYFLYLIIFCIVLLVIKAVFAKDFKVQILYTNAITTLCVVLIIGIGEILQNDYYVDIAIIYALLSFVSVNAYLYLKKNRCSHKE